MPRARLDDGDCRVVEDRAVGLSKPHVARIARFLRATAEPSVSSALSDSRPRVVGAHAIAFSPGKSSMVTLGSA
jgi:hypothetical protein